MTGRISQGRQTIELRGAPTPPQPVCGFGEHPSVRKPLPEVGLAVTQIVMEREKGPSLVTLLLHKSGESISSELALRAKERPAINRFGTHLRQTLRIANHPRPRRR